MKHPAHPRDDRQPTLDEFEQRAIAALPGGLRDRVSIHVMAAELRRQAKANEEKPNV